MADDDTEIPEAKDPFERQVALTVAILAVILSVISSAMDSSRLKALLASSQASDQWAYYQAKSMKETNYSIASKALKALKPEVIDDDVRTKMMGEFDEKAVKYTKDKADIQAKASGLAEEVRFQDERIEKLEKAEMLLHIAIVLGSITILVRLPVLWWSCLALGVVGVLLGLLPFVTPLPAPEPDKADAHGFRPAVVHPWTGQRPSSSDFTA